MFSSLVRSSSSCLGLHDSRQLWLPLVAILNELLLVVEELLVQEGRVLEVGALDDGIDGASLLTEATEDALGHIDVVLRRTARAVRPRLRLNLDSEGGACCLAKFASNATLFTSWVAAQGMFATEHGTEWTLLPRVVQDVIRLEGRLDSEEEDRPDQLSVE